MHALNRAGKAAKWRCEVISHEDLANKQIRNVSGYTKNISLHLKQYITPKITQL